MKKEIVYKEVEFPFEVVSFNDLNARQARVFFQYYIEHIPERINVLQEYMKYEGIDMKFDFSPESLIPLWEWYEEKLEIKTKTTEELEKEVKKFPEWMRESIIKNDKKVIAGGIYFYDIAIYFAETIRKNNADKVEWGYVTRPKSYVYVNRPV